MTSIEEARKLMPEETKGLSDKEVEEIIFVTNMLVGVAYDAWDEERKKALQDKMKANAVEKERIKKEKSGLEPPSTPIPDEEADTEEEIHSDKELKKKVTKEKVEKKKGKKAKK